MSFSLVHYLAVKSAVEKNHPDTVFFHFQYEPMGEWWRRTLPLVTLHPVIAPTFAEGRPLLHFAHKSDVLRLQMLQRYGGIYMDMDTICIKPFDELLDHHFVIGSELDAPFVPKNFRQQIKQDVKKWLGLEKKATTTVEGLCNAVMLSEPNSLFVNRWLKEYRSFRSQGHDKYWDEHSVQVPGKLAREMPEAVTIINPYAFYYPLYDKAGLAALFQEDHVYPGAYAHHLWESFAWEPYLSKLTVKDIREKDTTYNRIARQYL